MKFLGIYLSREPKGENLLRVMFDDKGREKTWMPKWADLCHLFRAAVVTEVINNHGKRSEQVKEFEDTAMFVKHICQVVNAMDSHE